MSWRAAALNPTGVVIAVASAVLAAAPALSAPWDGREPLILAWGLAAYAATIVVALRSRSQGMSSINAVTRSVQAEQPELPPAAVAPDGTVTILFTDIDGSTVLTERLGDERWIALLHEHNRVIREQIRAHGGYEVKTIGDAFMVAFQSARRGLECAIAIQTAISSAGWDGLLPPQEPAAGLDGAPPEAQLREGPPLRVRIGLHAGEAIKDSDDFYGRTVNFASRIEAIATGGQVLVSSTLRELVAGGEFRFDGGRDVELRGLSGIHRVFEAMWPSALRAQPQPSITSEQTKPGDPLLERNAVDFNRVTEEALKNIHNPSALGRSKLGEMLPATLAAMRGPAQAGRAPATPLEQAQLLRQVLESSMEALRKAAGPDLPAEGKALQYLILHEEYVLGKPNTSIMTRHSISESTFHRNRREAIHAIAAELAAQEALLVRPANQPS